MCFLREVHPRSVGLRFSLFTDFFPAFTEKLFEPVLCVPIFGVFVTRYYSLKNKKMERSRFHRSAVVGLIFIFAGLFLIAGNMNLIHYPLRHILFSWPMLLVALGVIFLASREGSLTGWILLIIGGFFLVPRIFPGVHFEFHLFFWPVLLIGLGLVMIFRFAGHNGKMIHRTEVNDEDYLDDVAIFGGGKKMFTSQNFQGGKITAIFGGSEIDLRQAKMAKGKVYVDYFAMFGGTKLFVPGDWDVKVEVSSIFGGFSDKRAADPRIVRDPSKQLIIKGVAIFGGGDLVDF
ncbi:MAG TPA: hypothetical protein ENN63_09890 [Bacteroidetes bacterium]|mgnify:CR=1 FL=1|nr:hypothetical protein [Bacteroidota bacterium]